MGSFPTTPRQRHRWTWTRMGALLMLLVTIAACGSAAAPTTTPPAATTPATGAAPAGTGGISQALIDAAKAEGELTVIALPHDWLNYGEMIANFSSKYGIKVNELDPNAGSGDEIESIKANKRTQARRLPM